MEFEYGLEIQYSESVEIQNIAQCAIELTTENFLNFYLVIKTILGETFILEHGPIVPDISTLPDDVTTKITKMEYNSLKIQNIITRFIANRKGEKTEVVREISFEEAFNAIRSISSYMKEVVEQEI